MIPMIGTEKRKTAITPSFRASTLAKYGGAVATGVTVTVPATAVVGDLAVIGVSCRSDTRTIIPPAGLTKIYDTRDYLKSTNGTGNVTTEGLSVYTVSVASGDPGVKTYKFMASGSGSEALIVVMGVYSGVDHIAVAPKGRTHYGGSWVSTTPLLSTLSLGEDNLQVGFITARTTGSFNLSYPKLSSMDADYTVRENDSVQVNSLNVPIGLSLHDSPTHGWDEETNVVMTNAGNVSWTHVVMELAGPNTNGWFENERYPKSIQNKPIYVYGTSNTCIVPRANLDYETLTSYPNEPKWTQQECYPDWLMSIGDPGKLGNHLGIGGTVSTDCATFAYGSNTNPTHGVPNTGTIVTDVAIVVQAGTWTAQTNKNLGGLVLLDIFGNDILGEATPNSQVRDGASIAADSLVRLIRSSEVRPHNYNVGTDTVYTGSWANQTSDGTIINNYGKTTVVGDYVEVVTDEAEIELLVLAVDSDNSSAPGANFTVSVNGTIVATDTTDNRMRRGGTSSPTPDYNYVQMAIPLSMGAGSHTVRLTHTGGDSGAALLYAGYLIPKADSDDTIPWCVLMGMQKMPYASTGFQPDATMQAYVDIANTVAERFPSRVLVYDPMANGQWTKQGHDALYGPAGTANNSFTLDGIHMNLRGHAFFARELMRFLNEHIP